MIKIEFKHYEIVKSLNTCFPIFFVFEIVFLNDVIVHLPFFGIKSVLIIANMLLVLWLAPLSHHHVPRTVNQMHYHHYFDDVSKFSESELLAKYTPLVQKEELSWDIESWESKHGILYLKSLLDAVRFIIWNPFAHHCFDICAILKPITLRVSFHVSDDSVDSLSNEEIFRRLLILGIRGH